jgi:protein phosphatase
MKVRCSAETDVGLKREINQDNYGIGEPSQSEEKGHLVVVCDGMGGHTAGEVASRLAVQAILAHYYQSDDQDRAASLEYAFFEANRSIYEDGGGAMGTTGVAALFFQGTLYVANVGDSRAYLVREGHIDQISRDHSLVAEQVVAGILTPEQARHSNYRNMITRALGYRAEVQVDVFSLPLQTGDVVVLSSDGLHGLVEDDEIGQVVSTRAPEEAVHYLITMANERGGIDNITAAIAVVDENDPIAGDAETSAADDETRPRLFRTSAHADESSSPAATDNAAPASAQAPMASFSSSGGEKPASSASLWRPGIWGGALAFLVVVLLGFVALRGWGKNILRSDTMQQVDSPMTLHTISPTIKLTVTSPLSRTPTLTVTTTMSTPRLGKTPSPTSTMQQRTRKSPSIP